MRISDMQRREPFEQILSDTLAAGWSEQYGSEVRVYPPEAAAGELWLMQPLLSVCYRQPLNSAARQFVRDSFRYTPVAWRRPAQWLLGTLLVSRALLPRLSQPLFRVEALPHHHRLLVLPGNQRVRVFDFERGLCRVMVKQGFERRLMQREIELRQAGRGGPFPAITAWAQDGRWFEEAIIDGYALPRLPRGYDRAAHEVTAFRQLDEWLAQSVQRVPIDQHLQTLCDRLTALLAMMRARHGFAGTAQVQHWIEVLGRESLPLSVVELAETHGDFQPGNIVVGRTDRQVWLIDWEHSRRRWRYYDHFVYTLRMRSLPGLARRLLACAHGDIAGAQLQPAWHSGVSRRAVLALIILEDMAWYAAESVSGPYRALPDSWAKWCAEMSTFGSELDTLFTVGAR